MVGRPIGRFCLIALVPGATQSCHIVGQPHGPWVCKRSGTTEGLHAAVNQKVVNFQAALYREFPDAVRVEGEEKF